jgi:hypothetical protein
VTAASPDAAVAAAAHTVLVGVIGGYGTPAQKGATFALVDQAYAASIARVTDGPARNKGVAVGRAAGAAILALRKDDGAFRDAPAGHGPASGTSERSANRPSPADLARLPAPATGLRRHTVTLLSASQFWLPGPPALTSATYARDYNEVKNIGGKVSATRTDEQTQIARFWFEGPGTWNTIARAVATTRRLDARDSARALALMNIAMADAYIAGFRDPLTV